MKKFSIALFIILLLLLGIITGVLTTSLGFRTIVGVIEKIIPGKLVVEQPLGQFDNFSIKRLYYATGQQQIIIEKFSMNWQPIKLIKKTLTIQSLNIGSIDINITKSNNKNSTKKTIGFKLPLALDIKNAQFGNVVWQQHLILKTLSLEVNTIANQINSKIKFTSPTYTGTFFTNGTFSNFIMQFVLNNSDNYVHIGGHISNTLDLNWNIQANQLAKLFPDIQGNLRGTGTIHGEKAKPIIVGNLGGDNLQFNTIKINHFDSKINFGLTPEYSSYFHLMLKKIRIFDYNAQQIDIDYQGKLSSHKIVMVMSNLQQRYMLNVIGNYSNNQWQAQITKIIADTKMFGQWKLLKATSLSLSKQSINLSNLCLTNISSNICIQASKNTSSSRGWLKIQNLKLSALQAFLPKNVFIRSGLIQADLNLNGRIALTDLNGQINLDNGNIALPAYGLNINTINSNLKIINGNIAYRASAVSNKGKLAILGSAKTNESNWQSQLQVQGDNFLIYHAADMKVDVSPTLNIDILGNDINITGSVLIPEADINFPEFNTVIKMPAETEYIDEKKNASSPLSFKITSKIRVSAGKNVRIDAAGIRGLLGGNILIQDELGKKTTALGQLLLQQGSYSIYGQTLKITLGELNYNGGPIDDPILNVQAIRNLRSAINLFDQSKPSIVGIKVQGNLSAPQTILFSEPTGLSQPDILSYLLIGKSSSQINQPDAQLIVSAMNALNMNGSNSSSFTNILNNLGQRFGFSQLDIETPTTTGQTGLTNASLVLGKYLSPRLYFGYSLGLLENKFVARYHLSKHFIAQTQAGTNSSSVDLLYSIQH